MWGYNSRSSYRTVSSQLREAQDAFLRQLAADREAFLREALRDVSDVNEEKDDESSEEPPIKQVDVHYFVKIEAELRLAEEDDTDQRCPICLHDYKVLDVISRFHCKHNFHKTCAARWLHQKKNCPMCRAKLDVRVTPNTQHYGRFDIERQTGLLTSPDTSNYGMERETGQLSRNSPER